MTDPVHPNLVRAEQLLNDADRAFEEVRYPDAEERYRAALELAEPLKEYNGSLVARCRLGLGRVLNTQSRFSEALALVSMTPSLLVDDFVMLGKAFTTLGEITANLGDMDRARVNIQSAYYIRSERLGPTHPDTLDSMSMLALLDFIRGEKGDAYDLIRSAVASATSYQGEPHPGIGRVYDRQGRILMGDPQRYEQARAALEHALAIFKASENPDHPDHGLALNNLASLLARRKHWGEARGLLLRSLEIHEHAFGPQSAFTMFVLINLSDMEQHLDNLESAYHYAARSLIAAMHSLGARSPHTLTALRRLVTVMSLQSQAGDANVMQKAMPFHICMVALEVAAGKHDPSHENQPGSRLPVEQAVERLERLVARLEMQVNRPPRSTEEQAEEQAQLEGIRELVAQGDAALENGDAVRAQAIYTLALNDQEALLGPDHLDHLPLIEKLVKASEAAGVPSEILPLCERVVAINTAVLGEDHPQTLLAMTRLYSRYLYEYGEEAALPLYERIQALTEQSLGPDDYNSRMTRSHLDAIRLRVQAVKTDQPRQERSRSERIEAALKDFNDPSGLLVGLDLVDWHGVTHAYGPADDVPRLLKLMLSPDQQIREGAWEDLDNRVWHQGTLYPATAAVAPFLIRLAADRNYPDQMWAFDTLAGWADSSSYLAVYTRPGSLLVDRNMVQEVIERPNQSPYFKPDVLEQVSQAVGQSLPLMIELLGTAEREIQLLALFTLSRLRDRETESVPAIMRLLENTGAPDLRTGALYALRSLLDTSPQSIAFFTRWATASQDDPQVIFQAAAGVVERVQESAPERVIDVLLSAWPAARERAVDEDLAGRNSQYSAFYQISASDLQLLACLGIARGTSALARALSLVHPPLGSESDLLLLAGVMLDLQFNAGKIQEKSCSFGTDLIDGVRITHIKYISPDPQPLRDPAGLTSSQRTTLETLANFPGLWTFRHNLLAIYGLPETQQDLRHFLGA